MIFPDCCRKAVGVGDFLAVQPGAGEEGLHRGAHARLVRALRGSAGARSGKRTARRRLAADVGGFIEKIGGCLVHRRADVGGFAEHVRLGRRSGGGGRRRLRRGHRLVENPRLHRGKILVVEMRFFNRRRLDRFHGHRFLHARPRGVGHGAC
jgi:hypothetical protein